MERDRAPLDECPPASGRRTTQQAGPFVRTTQKRGKNIGIHCVYREKSLNATIGPLSFQQQIREIEMEERALHSRRQMLEAELYYIRVAKQCKF